MTETQETFLSHLIELRERLVRALVVYAIACVPTLYFSAELYDLLAAPLMANLPEGSRMIATGVITPFLIPMKISFMAAFVVALPYLLYQVWAFVAPGLYAHEKRLALPLVVSSTLLFLVGMLFCYFIVFGKVFAFIQSFAPKSISVAPDIEAYFNFVLGMFLAFGLAFEVPVVVVVLVITGLVNGRAAARMARLRDRGDLRGGRRGDAARTWSRRSRSRSRCASSTRSGSSSRRSCSGARRATRLPGSGGELATRRRAPRRAALAHGHVQRELLVAADHPHRHRLARRHLGDRVERRAHVGHGAAR